MDELRPDETVVGFNNALVSLRSVIRRLIRSSLGSAALTSAEGELLMLVRVNEGATVQRLAQLLGNAPNTVSTLVTGLTGMDLLERRERPADRRSVGIFLSKAGWRMTDAIQARRVALIKESFVRMPVEHQRALQNALPSIHLLIDELDSLEVRPMDEA